MSESERIEVLVEGKDHDGEPFAMTMIPGQALDLHDSDKTINRIEVRPPEGSDDA